MTQQEKQLLLKDLCARLPYGVKYMRYAWNFEWDQERPLIETLEYLDKDGFVFPTRVYNVSDIKPYLRPMSSMTEKEKENLQSLHDSISDENYGDGYSPAAWDAITEWEDFCNARHLDYRGLIPMGLALEAPKGMYKTE